MITKDAIDSTVNKIINEEVERRLKECLVSVTSLDVVELLEQVTRERDQLRIEFNEYRQDKKHLARELDIAINGIHGAAKQASLCDLISPASKLRQDKEKLEAEVVVMRKSLKEINREEHTAACTNAPASLPCTCFKKTIYDALTQTRTPLLLELVRELEKNSDRGWLVEAPDLHYALKKWMESK